MAQGHSHPNCMAIIIDKGVIRHIDQAAHFAACKHYVNCALNGFGKVSFATDFGAETQGPA